MAGFENDVLVCTNVNFSPTAAKPHLGVISADGQLLIGSAVAPFLRAATLTSGTALSIVNASGSITLGVDGTVPTSFVTNSGSVVASGNVINLTGTGSITTTASGNTVNTTLFGLTPNAVLVGNAVNSIASLAVGATGTLLVGATAANPAFATSANGDFTFTTATSGATRTLSVTNTSNTANSNALQQVTVAGASAGDAFTTHTISGVTNWSHGIDNSVSGDPFVVAASTALGTTNVMSMTTGGAVSCVLGDFDVTRSSGGANVINTVSNTSNTGSSNALQQVTVAGTSAGDAFTTYTISGTTNWSVGTDNSVTGDPFVIAASTALGTTNIMSSTTGGAINYPLQPAFLATKTAAQNTATGDATTVTVGFSTEIYDQGNNYDATNTFTAPVTGRYAFTAGLNFTGTLVGHTIMGFNFVASNRTLNTCGYEAFNITPTGATCIVNTACEVDMDTADTVVMSTNVNGGAKVINLTGGFFSGHLIC